MASKQRTGPTDTLSALAILQAFIAGADDPIPAGFRTAAQWAEEWGKSRVHAGVLLRRGVALGVVDVVRLKITNGQVTRATPFYAIKGAP